MLVKPPADVSMRVFELPEMAEILGIPFAKAKNWTNGRTGLEIKPSVRPAGGTGKSGLYSAGDLYLMAVAREFSKAGFAAAAIGVLAELLKPKFERAIPAEEIWTIWRPQGAGAFRIQSDEMGPTRGHFWQTLRIGALLEEVNQAAVSFAKRRERVLSARKKAKA